MIEYLIRSGLVMAILLAIYHLWLEKEKMHRFNRFYLLFSLFLGLAIPVVKITLPFTQTVPAPLQLEDLVIPGFSPAVPAAINKVSGSNYTDLPIMIYSLVALLLLARFTGNLIILMRTVSRNPKKNTREGTIVLIKEKLAPHSFLFFTFLNEDDYLNQRIEKEIITHEFAHVRQKHSADLLLLELLMVLFWFNPAFIFYKKAIQLNHEFLADEAVIESSCSISTYQQLLLQKTTLKSVSLASNFNFSVTKKRFKMMKKQTSKTWRVVKAVSLIPVAAVLIVSFSDQTFAQGTSATSELKIKLSGSTQISKEEYYRGGLVRFKESSGNTVTKKYETLTDQEKNTFPAPQAPTKELLQSWNQPGYIVMHGYNKLTGLNKLKAEDFIAYYVRKSEEKKINYVNLITAEWLKTYKSYGGIFHIRPEGLALLLPPPVVVPPKKN